MDALLVVLGFISICCIFWMAYLREEEHTKQMEIAVKAALARHASEVELKTVDKSKKDNGPAKNLPEEARI